MSRYIDADKLRADWLENGENEYVYDTNAFLDSIDNAPTADVVGVVRCRECRFWTKMEDSAQGHCLLSGGYPTVAWFCANGERRTDNG